MKILIGLLFFSLNAFADEIPFHFNCYLPNDVVDCDQLRTQFLSGNKDVKLVSENLAKVSISIRSTSLTNITEYKLKFDGSDKLDDIVYNYNANNKLSSVEILEQIISSVNHITALYRLALGQTAIDSNNDKQKFYIEPQASFPFSQGQGFKGYVLNASVGGNYSTPKWRYAGSTYLVKNDQQVDETAFNTGVRTKTFWIGADVLVVKSFNKHWDVAVFVGTHSNDTDIELSNPNPEMNENALHNRATKTYFKAGVEWLAIPFIQDNSKGNIALRYFVGPEFHSYVDPLSYEHIQETFVKHSLEALAAQHFNKVDLSLGVTAYKTSFRTQPVTGLKGAITTTFRVTPRLSLSGSFNLEYAKNRVPSPVDANTSFANLTSDQKTALFYNGSVGLRYTFGNSRLNSKEQRWKKE